MFYLCMVVILYALSQPVSNHGLHAGSFTYEGSQASTPRWSGSAQPCHDKKVGNVFAI